MRSILEDLAAECVATVAEDTAVYVNNIYMKDPSFGTCLRPFKQSGRNANLFHLWEHSTYCKVVQVSR